MPDNQEAPLGALPPPSAVLALAAACLLEVERNIPGIIERVRLRLENEAAVNAAVRIRGPRTEPQVRAAVESALAWISVVSVVAEAERPAKRRFWGAV